jgi:hypothetical protein
LFVRDAQFDFAQQDKRSGAILRRLWAHDGTIDGSTRIRSAAGQVDPADPVRMD